MKGWPHDSAHATPLCGRQVRFELPMVLERGTSASSVVSAVGSLWMQSEGRKVGRELSDAGYPVLVLKGPDLQLRLFGTPAAYASADVDVLVRRGDGRGARGFLRSRGWTSVTENSLLWPLSAEA